MRHFTPVLALSLLGLSGCVAQPGHHHGGGHGGPPPPATVAPPPPPATMAPPPAATTPAPAAITPPAATAPPGPAFDEVADPPAPPVEEPKGAAEGRPAGLKDGAPEGVWIWHDPAGWHLRTTTAKNLHQFRGAVWGMKGAVGNVKVVKTEQGDRFRQKGNRLNFDFQTKGHEDGFDFMIAESDCALFNVLIDGKGQNDRIKIGAKSVSPKHHVFKVCQLRCP